MLKLLKKHPQNDALLLHMIMRLIICAF